MIILSPSLISEINARFILIASKFAHIDGPLSILKKLTSGIAQKKIINRSHMMNTERIQHAITMVFVKWLTNIQSVLNVIVKPIIHHCLKVIFNYLWLKHKLYGFYIESENSTKFSWFHSVITVNLFYIFDNCFAGILHLFCRHFYKL